MLKTTGVGYLTKDAGVISVNGSEAVKFTVAINYLFGKQKQIAEQEGKPTAIFLDCIGWGQRYVSISKYLGKGSQVVVTGDFSLNVWGDSNENIQYNLSLDGLDIVNSKSPVAEPWAE